MVKQAHADRAKTAEAATLAILALHNWASNRRIPAGWYVPTNLAAAALLVTLARWGGASWHDLGLRRDRIAGGARGGATASAALSAAVAAALAAPRTRGWFADERATAPPTRTAAYHVAIRIPLGTALAEELEFRGALLALSLQRRSPVRSLLWTSLLFGAWHVLPTVATLPGNPLGRQALRTSGRIRAVTAAVVATGAAGAGFALLRAATGSVVAPALAHAVVNVAAYLGARRVHGRASAGVYARPGGRQERPYASASWSNSSASGPRTASAPAAPSPWRW